MNNGHLDVCSFGSKIQTHWRDQRRFYLKIQIRCGHRTDTQPSARTKNRRPFISFHFSAFTGMNLEYVFNRRRNWAACSRIDESFHHFDHFLLRNGIIDDERTQQYIINVHGVRVKSHSNHSSGFGDSTVTVTNFMLSANSQSFEYFIIIILHIWFRKFRFVRTNISTSIRKNRNGRRFRCHWIADVRESRRLEFFFFWSLSEGLSLFYRSTVNTINMNFAEIHSTTSQTQKNERIVRIINLNIIIIWISAGCETTVGETDRW